MVSRKERLVSEERRKFKDVSFGHRYLSFTLDTREALQKEFQYEGAAVEDSVINALESLCGEYLDWVTEESKKPRGNDIRQTLEPFYAANICEVRFLLKNLDSLTFELLNQQGAILIAQREGTSADVYHRAEEKFIKNFAFREEVLNHVKKYHANGRPRDDNKKRMACLVAKILTSAGFYPTKSVSKQYDLSHSGPSSGAGLFARILDILFRAIGKPQKKLTSLVSIGVKEVRFPQIK